MWIGIVIMGLVGMVSFVLGFLISKGHLNLIHSYHRQNIDAQDKKAYGKLFAKGLYIIGVGCFVSSIFAYYQMVTLVLIAIFSSILFGGLVIHKAQKNTMVESFPEDVF